MFAMISRQRPSDAEQNAATIPSIPKQYDTSYSSCSGSIMSYPLVPARYSFNDSVQKRQKLAKSITLS